MKQRLDLDSLLHKYEKGFLTEGDRGKTYHSPKHHKPINPPRLKTEHNYYQQTKPYSNQPFRPMHQTSRVQNQYYNNNNYNQNFSMSKSQCIEFLAGIRNSLKNEQIVAEQYLADCYRRLVDKFERDHGQLRRQLIDLVDRSFLDNEKMVREMIESYSKQLPREYIDVQQKINSIDHQVARLLNGLKGQQYKKTIAEVVTTDFNNILKEVRLQMQRNNQMYGNSLANIEIDGQKMESIRSSLNNIYKWKQNQRVYNPVSPVQTLNNYNAKPQKPRIFEQNPVTDRMAATDRYDLKDQQPRRMRKSFFNFQQNY